MCTQKPCGVRSFASFVIDLKSVTLQQIYVTSSPRRIYEVSQQHDKMVFMTCCQDDPWNYTVTIYRQYGKLLHEFRWIIISVLNSGRSLLQVSINGFKANKDSACSWACSVGLTSRNNPNETSNSSGLARPAFVLRLQKLMLNYQRQTRLCMELVNILYCQSYPTLL